MFVRRFSCLAVFCLLLQVPVGAVAQSGSLTVAEPGYTVTDLGTSSGPKGAACSPGGVWGNYVYIGESSGDAIERIDFSDVVSFFAGGAPEIDFPVGMLFGPGPAADFGTYLYVASFQSDRITRIDPSGSPATWLPFTAISDLAFDPTGVYGTEMFAVEYFGPIYKVQPDSLVTLWASGIQASYLRFGPGGPWGTGLYAANNSGAPGVGIIQVDAAGTASLFAGGFVTPEQFDWGFGGDMFATDYGAATVYRIQPDGTTTVFATVDPQERPAGLVFCNGCMYLTSFGGGCWKICESPVSVEPSTWSGIKQKHRASGDPD